MESKIHELKYAISKDIVTAKRCLLAIYKYQTLDEKQSQATIKVNGFGFSKTDSTVLSKIAEEIINGNEPMDKECTICMKLMPKYAGQWLKIKQMEKNDEQINVLNG